MGPSAFNQWRSLIVVSGSPYRVDTSKFASKVREYNQHPPFGFNATKVTFQRFNFTIHISIYAAHLYDSAMLYARALHALLEEEKKVNPNFGPGDVNRISRDGRAITGRIIRMGGYQSISGNYIRIDRNGDSEGNFTAFALKEHNYTYVSRITGSKKFSCGHYPVKVGEFYSEMKAAEGNNGTEEAITYLPKVIIDWPGNHKPVDEPHCGYDGSNCPRTQGQTKIAAGVLGAFLFLLILLSGKERSRERRKMQIFHR